MPWKDGWAYTEKGLPHVISGVTTSKSDRWDHICYDNHWGHPVVHRFKTIDLAQHAQKNWDKGEHKFGGIDANEDDDTGCGVLVIPKITPGYIDTIDFVPDTSFENIKDWGIRAQKDLAHFYKEQGHNVTEIEDATLQLLGYDLIVDGEKVEVKMRTPWMGKYSKIFVQITERNPKQTGRSLCGAFGTASSSQ